MSAKALQKNRSHSLPIFFLICFRGRARREARPSSIVPPRHLLRYLPRHIRRRLLRKHARRRESRPWKRPRSRCFLNDPPKTVDYFTAAKRGARPSFLHAPPRGGDGRWFYCRYFIERYAAGLQPFLNLAPLPLVVRLSMEMSSVSASTRVPSSMVTASLYGLVT